MMNMGGPSTIPEVEPFLNRLFLDQDIMQLKEGPAMRALAYVIVKRRLNRVQQQYKDIGGGSPIHRLSDQQGFEMVKHLDRISPETGPHKHYIGFRYAAPLVEDALKKMVDDGVERVIAFSQYPHWSCTTAGSSYNDLWDNLKKLKLEDRFKWSLIDRWPLEPKFIEAVSQNIENALKKFKSPEDAIIVFSAHSIPMKTVNRGDHYPHEVHRTISAIMSNLESKGINNYHIAAWQSKVGSLPWLGPQTEDTLKGLGKMGKKAVCIVPIAFTTDHIETLFEIDVEYAEVAHESGIAEYHRAESLNDSPLFAEALADIVKRHLDAKENYSPRYKMSCSDCFSPDRCRSMMNPAYPELA